MSTKREKIKECLSQLYFEENGERGYFIFGKDEAVERIIRLLNISGANLDLEKMGEKFDEILKNTTKEDVEKFLEEDRKQEEKDKNNSSQNFIE